MKDAISTERWCPIPGYEGHYEVSDLGRVKSLNRVVVRSNGWKITIHERILATDKNGKYGHLAVKLGKSGREKYKRFLVHHLVLKAFVGPCPVGMECRHLDGTGSNNRLDNLRWGTSKENKEDVIRHGRSIRGERSDKHKLSTESVIKIRRELFDAPYGILTKIARRYGVCRQAIADIRDGRNWAWLK